MFRIYVLLICNISILMYINAYYVLLCFYGFIYPLVAPLGHGILIHLPQVKTRKILFGDLLERVDKHLEQFDVVPLAFANCGYPPWN